MQLIRGTSNEALPDELFDICVCMSTLVLSTCFVVFQLQQNKIVNDLMLSMAVFQTGTFKDFRLSMEKLQTESQELAQHATYKAAPMTAGMAALYALYIFRMILYFRYHKWLSVMVDTITISAKQLAHFFPVLLLVYLAMMGLSHLFIGPFYLGFSTLDKTAASLSNMVVGNWDIQDIHAPVHIKLAYELIFFLLMIALLLNLLVAIVVEAFVQVKARLHQSEHDPTYSDFLWHADTHAPTHPRTHTHTARCRDAFIYFPSRTLAARRNKWPSIERLLNALRGSGLTSDSLVTPQLIASSLQISSASASALLQFYSKNFPALRPHQATGKATNIFESASSPRHDLAAEKQLCAISQKLDMLLGDVLQNSDGPPGSVFVNGTGRPAKGLASPSAKRELPSPSISVAYSEPTSPINASSRGRIHASPLWRDQKDKSRGLSRKFSQEGAFVAY